MVITVSFLGVVLFVFIIVFLLNKRRLIAIYYPKVPVVNENKNGTLRLLTYNVAGLPERISSAKTKRYDSMLIIGEKINAYDIVNVQEDFNYNIQLYSVNNHTFKTSHRGKAVWGDGLNTFSNFPIVEFRRVAWKKCNGSDCLTPKGFSMARISLAKGVLVDVYNVHANAGHSSASAKARRHNLLQLADYILDQSVNMPLIVMGDFNAHYQFNLDNMSEFINLTSLQDSWVSTVQQGNYPTVKENFEFISDLDCTNEIESIDKILFRNSTSLFFEPIAYKIENEAFLNEEKLHLSDHLAVSVQLNWKTL